MGLTVNNHRIDNAANVIDRGIADYLDDPAVRLNFDLDHMGPVWIGGDQFGHLS